MAADDDVPSRSDVEEQFRSLMEGLRTTLPGVQVLLAFLLTLPLQGAFADLRLFDQIVYQIALTGAATASVLLIAPSAHQRLRALRGGVGRQSSRHLRVAVRLTVAGTIAAAIAICAVVYLASTLVFDDTFAAVLTTAIAALVVWTWFEIPLVQFRNDGADRAARSG